MSGCALLCFQSRDRQVQLLPFRLLHLLSSVRKHGPLEVLHGMASRS